METIHKTKTCSSVSTHTTCKEESTTVSFWNFFFSAKAAFPDLAKCTFFLKNDANVPSSRCLARSLIEKTSPPPASATLFPSFFGESAACLPVYGSNICVVFHDGLLHIAAAAHGRAGHLTLPKPRRRLGPGLFIYLLIVCLCLLGFYGQRGSGGPAGKLGLIAAIEAESRLITGRASPRGACSSRPRQRRRMGVDFGSEGGGEREEEGGRGGGGGAVWGRKVCSQSVI